MPLSEILVKNRTSIALVIGNGINRYPNNPNAISWDNLLLQLWQKFAPDSFKGDHIPKGLTLTEFYDILDLSNIDESITGSLIQKEAIKILDDWDFREHHRRIIGKAMTWDIPVLTTNFDLLLPASHNLTQFYMNKRSFTDFYPWDSYYGNRQLQTPVEGFGIWFINGFVRYHRSIRLGLTHYMGCVDRARNMLHRGESNPFSGKNQESWAGRNSWLHIVFNRDLCILGLSLEENEVFIRWLLIERAKYFKKFPERRKKGWYISSTTSKLDENIEGKKMFMKSVGLEFVEVVNYDAIYSTPWI